MQADGELYERARDRMKKWQEKFRIGDRVYVFFTNGQKSYGQIISIAPLSVVVKMDNGQKKRMDHKHIWPLEVPRPAENVIPFTQVKRERKKTEGQRSL